MRTMVNGKNADWTPEIFAKWHTFADRADPKFFAGEVLDANYFTPRPYQDEYSRGSREEGFTFTVRSKSAMYGPSVHQTIIRRHNRVGGDPA